MCLKTIRLYPSARAVPLCPRRVSVPFGYPTSAGRSHRRHVGAAGQNKKARGCARSSAVYDRVSPSHARKPPNLEWQLPASGTSKTPALAAA